MGDTLSVTLDTSKDFVQPTLEEEAAKYDEPAPAEERPEWLPEKFKSPEDLAKAYNELQAKLGSRSQPSEEPAPSVEEPEEQEAKSDNVEDQAREAVENAGLDFDSLSQKFWDNGALDDGDFEALEKSGIPRGLVEQFIAGQEAVLDATRQSVFSSVGGEEAYNDLTEWAGDNLGSDEIDAFNRAVNSGDKNMTMLAVKGLHARYRSEVGSEPARQIKGETVKSGADTYRSLAELQKDMSDARYRNDPAFRRDVEQKLSRSDIM
jgi:hypothetical protein